MEPFHAIEIVQKLADGVDPFTDERFPSSSPYQQADTVRALHLALEGLAKLKRSTARKTGPGRPWSEDEEKDLLRKFDDKVDVGERGERGQPGRKGSACDVCRKGLLGVSRCVRT